MSKLAIRAEVIKLERLYGVDENTLNFLQTLPAEEIRKLREAAQAKLFGDDLTLFQRLAAASVLLPLALIAMMAEKIFGPVLGARVAGEMNYKRAVDLAGRLPIPFLADISLQLDPKRAREIIQNLPPERIRDVAVELLKRHEFITMGRFVDYLTEAAIRKSMEAFTNPADLLHAGFFIENKAQLNNLIRMLTDERLRGVIIAAQDPEQNLWSEAVALMEHVDSSLKRKLGDLAAEQDESALAGLCRTAYEQDLWDSVLPVVACMSEPSHRKLLRIPALSDRKIMESILKAADNNGLWTSFLPLIRLMSPEQLAMIAEVAVQLPAGALENILRAAHTADLWDSVLHLVEDMNEAQIAQLGAAATVLPREAIARIIQIADEKKLWHALLPLAGKMDDNHKRMIAGLAGLVSHDTRERIVAAARVADNKHWPALLDIVAHIPPEERAEFADVIADHAEREPHLVEVLAPEAKARGLDDLLDIARRALAGERTRKSGPDAKKKHDSVAPPTSDIRPSQKIIDKPPAPETPGRLRGVARFALKRVETVLGVSDDSLIAQQAATIQALQSQLQAADDSLKSSSTLQVENTELREAAAKSQQKLQKLERELDDLRHQLNALNIQKAQTTKTPPITKAPDPVPTVAPRPEVVSQSQPAAPPAARSRPVAARQPFIARSFTAISRFIAKPVDETQPVVAKPVAAKPYEKPYEWPIAIVRSVVTPRSVSVAQPVAAKTEPEAAKPSAPAPVKPGMSASTKTILIICGLVAVLVIAILGGTLLPILFH